MANKQVTLKRVIDTSGNTDTIHPTTDWDQVESKPSTFTPTAHTHTLSDITDAGTVAAINLNSSTTQFLRGDGTFATPAGVDNYVNITGDTMTGSLSIQTTTTGDTLLLETTENSSTAAPVLTFMRESLTPADGDYLGQLKFKARNDANQETVMAKITGKISDVTDGTEDGLIEFANRKAGSNVITARLTSTDLKLINGTGLQVDGNVGIGLTNPATELEVDGDIQLVRTKNIIFGETPGGNARARIFSTQNEFSADYNGLGFSTGANGRTNPTMYIRSTNNSVGIGTTNPTEKLEVAGNIRIDSASFASLTLDRESTTSGSIVQFTNNGGVIGGIGGFGNDGLQFRTTDGTQMVIDASNNVGIGTETPTQKLEVDGNINANELHLNDTNTIVKEGTSNQVKLQTNYGFVEIGPRNNSWAHFYTDKPSFYFGQPMQVNGNIAVYDNNTTKLENSTGYIYELGNRVATQSYVTTQINNLVDSAPLALDTLNELAAALGDDANFSTTVTNSIATKLPLAGGTMSGSIAMANNNITGINQIEINDPGEGIVFKQGSSGDMTLKIIDDTTDNILEYSGSSAKFRVAGSLDIKSSNPLLTLEDTGTTTGNAYIDYQAGTSLKVHAGGDALTFVAGNAERARISSSGNFGIGQTNPTARLEVIGDIKIKQGAGYGNYGLIDQTEALMEIDTYSVNTATHAADIVFRPNLTERMRITDDGLVGIGTSSPGYNLDVVGNIRAKTGSSTKIWAENTTSGQSSLELKSTTTHMRLIGQLGGFQMYDQIDGASRFEIDTNGNSKIFGNLTVQSTYPRIYLTDTDSDSDYSVLNGSGYFSVYDDTNGKFRMRINSSGNTIFGDGNPNNLGFLENSLEIQAGSSSDTTLKQAGLIISGSSDADDADDFAYLSFRNNHSSLSNDRVAEIRVMKNGTNVDTADMHFYTANGSSLGAKLSILNSGNVGIGTTSPAQELEVVGSVRASDNFEKKGSGGYYLYNSSMGFRGAFYDSGSVTSIYGDGNGSTPVININSDKVGIGDTSPQGKLTVEQDMTNGGSAFSAPHLALNASNTVDSTGFVGMTLATSTADNYGWSYGAQRTSSGIGDLRWRNHSGTSAGNDRMILTSGGNLGVGVSSPSYAVDVSGDVNVTGNFKINGANLEAGGNTWTEIKTGMTTISSGTAVTNVSLGSNTVDDTTVLAIEINSGTLTSYTSEIIIVKLEDSDNSAAGILYNASANSSSIQVGSVRVFRTLSMGPTSTSISFTDVYYFTNGSSSETADTIYVGKIWKLGVTGS